MVVANGTGTALQSFTCGLNQVLSFNVTGVAVCQNVSSIFQGFTQGGNSFAATGTLGTSDNNALNIVTNNTSAIFIDATGRVGIGTTSPNNSLVISVNSIGSPFAGALKGLSIVNQDTSANSLSGILFSGTENTGANARHSGAIVAGKEASWAPASSNYPGFLSFWTRPPNSDETEKMRITSTGRIGIGTTSPAGILDVQGGSAAANTDGTSINLIAQNAGSGNQAGGNIILTPGAGSGTGVYGFVGIGTSSQHSFAAPMNILNSTALSGGMTSGLNVTNNPTNSPAVAPARLYGIEVNSTSSDAVNAGNTIGLEARAYAINNTTTSNNVIAANFAGYLNGAGSVTNLTGSRSIAQVYPGTVTSGTIASAISLLAAGPTVAATSASMTNAYSLYIETPVSGTNQWALYQTGTGNNYFGGKVGIGSATPLVSLDLSTKTDAVSLPASTTANRPASPLNGMIRYNSDNAKLESYVSGAWRDIATTTAGGSFLSTTGGTLTGALAVTTITSGGTNSIALGGSNGTSLNVLDGGAGAVNAISIKGSATGSSPVISATGSDANIDLTLSPKGTGNFIITSGKVGIGTNSPSAPLHTSDGNYVSPSLYSGTATYNLTSTQGATVPGFVGISASSSGAGYRTSFTGIRAGGTLGAPVAPAVGDNVVSLIGAVFDGTVSQNTAQVTTVVDGAVSAGVAPQRIEFSTSTTSNAARTTKMTILSGGNVGIGTLSPTSALQVVGSSVAIQGQRDNTDTSNALTAISAVNNDQTVNNGVGISMASVDSGGTPYSGAVVGAQFMSHTAGSHVTDMRFLVTNRSVSASPIEKMRIAGSTGNVGIGTSSPTNLLTVSSNSTGATVLRLENTDTGGRAWNFRSSGSAAVGGAGSFKIDDVTAGATRMMIDTNGNVGIGSSSPRASLWAMDTTAASSLRGVASAQYINTSAGPQFAMVKSRGTETAPVVVNNGDFLGDLTSWGYDGANLQRTAIVRSMVTGTVSAGTIPTSMAFYTSNTGTAGLAERMRIDNNGFIGINTNSPDRPLVINNSTNTLTPGNSAILLVGESNTERIEIREFANGGSMSPTFMGSAANGTQAAPTAVTADTNLVTLSGFGWNGTAYGGITPTANSAAGNIGIFASETHDSTHKGSYINFTTTQKATTTRTERMRIDDMGYVGIGTTSPVTPLEVVSTSTSDPRGITQSQYSADSLAPQISLRKARGTPTAPSAVLSGDVIGNFRGQGFDGSAFVAGGALRVRTQEDWTGTNHGTFLVLETIPLGSSTLTERVRVDAAGNVGIGTTSPNYKLHVLGAAASTVAYFEDGTASCSITPSSAGAVSCSSDERLKKNINPVADALSLDRILKLNTVTYQWKNGNEAVHTGYIAQEMEKVAPEFVNTGANGYKQVSYTGLIPWITGAIKELYQKFSEEIATLKDENQQLKAENEQLKKRLDAIEKRLSENPENK